MIEDKIKINLPKYEDSDDDEDEMELALLQFRNLSLS